MLSRQEIFDKVAAHLLSQMKRSQNSTGCAYRGADDTKCAVGCLIPDALYSPDMELKRVWTLFRAFPDAMVASGLSEADSQFLDQLQSVHDVNEPKYWRGELAALAARHQLATTAAG